jgi:hypothetical protein
MGRASRGANGSVVTAGVTLLLVVLLAPPVRGAVGELGYCTFQAQGYADPGLSTTPAEGVDRYEGTISCRGVINGRQVRREPGTIRMVLHYGTGAVSQLRGGDDCFTYSGHGTIDVTLSTDHGPLSMHGALDSVGGSAGEVHGHLGSSPFEGLMEFELDPDYPEETCVTTPRQHGVVDGQIVLGV